MLYFILFFNQLSFIGHTCKQACVASEILCYSGFSPFSNKKIKNPQIDYGEWTWVRKGIQCSFSLPIYQYLSDQKNYFCTHLISLVFHFRANKFSKWSDGRRWFLLSNGECNLFYFWPWQYIFVFCKLLQVGYALYFRFLHDLATGYVATGLCLIFLFSARFDVWVLLQVGYVQISFQNKRDYSEVLNVLLIQNNLENHQSIYPENLWKKSPSTPDCMRK